jgi:DNA-binding transcriptional regulator YiaG
MSEPMDKAEFRRRLSALGMTLDEFAGLNGVSLRSVYAWGSRSAVPYWARNMIKLFEQQGGVYGFLGRPDPWFAPENHNKNCMKR